MLLCESDDNIVAVATDSDINIKNNIVVLDINKPQEIADFINKFLNIIK